LLSVVRCTKALCRRHEGVMSAKRHNQSRRSARCAGCGADCRAQARPLTFDPVADQTNGGDNSDHEYSQQHGVFDEGCSVFVFSETFENFDGFAHNDLPARNHALFARRGSLAATQRVRFRQNPLRRFADVNAKIALIFDFESNPFVSINHHLAKSPVASPASMLKEACHICLFVRVCFVCARGGVDASATQRCREIFFRSPDAAEERPRALAKIGEALLSHWALNARDRRNRDRRDPFSFQLGTIIERQTRMIRRDLNSARRNTGINMSTMRHLHAFSERQRTHG
jgi:hypothetical protein